MDKVIERILTDQTARQESDLKETVVQAVGGEFSAWA
jgi:hypothetical protein